jgi:hypothetical protein
MKQSRAPPRRVASKHFRMPKGVSIFTGDGPRAGTFCATIWFQQLATDLASVEVTRGAGHRNEQSEREAAPGQKRRSRRWGEKKTKAQLPLPCFARALPC